MRFFGKKSLSSFLRIIFEIIWYIILIVHIIALIIFFTGKHTQNILNPFEYSGLIFILNEESAVPNSLIFLNFPVFIFSIFTIWILKEIFKSFTNEEIFTKKNFIRFQFIGILLIIYGLIDPIINFLKAKALLKFILVENAQVKANIDFPGLIFIGLVILIIAEVFKRAVSFKEENDLTI